MKKNPINIKPTLGLVLLTFAIGFIATPLAWILTAQIFGSSTIAEDFVTVMKLQFREGTNLFLLELWTLVPFACISIYALTLGRKLNSIALFVAVSVSALVTTLMVISMYIQIWRPLYTPHVMSSTSVLGFLVIPPFAAIVAGFVIGVLHWLLR